MKLCLSNQQHWSSPSDVQLILDVQSFLCLPTICTPTV